MDYWACIERQLAGVPPERQTGRDRLSVGFLRFSPGRLLGDCLASARRSFGGRLGRPRQAKPSQSGTQTCKQSPLHVTLLPCKHASPHSRLPLRHRLKLLGAEHTQLRHAPKLVILVPHHGHAGARQRHPNAVFAMPSSCLRHASAMPVPRHCNCYATAAPSPARFLPLPCHNNAIARSPPCHCLVTAVPLPCHRRAIALSCHASAMS